MNLFRPRFADGERLDLDGIAVRLRVNRRARRISLRFDGATGEAVVTAPSLKHLPDAADFARSRHGWLAGQIAAVPRPLTLAAGDRIAVLGAPWVLTADGRRPRLSGFDGEGLRTLRGCGDGEVDIQLVIRAIKRESFGLFQTRAGAHCEALGLVPPPISLSDARGRWGSCTPARAGRTAAIRLSWRLALAPFEVADYVIAHECAHLIEANHGPRFWGLVRDLVGEARCHRTWLKANGARLHAFGRRGGAP